MNERPALRPVITGAGVLGHVLMSAKGFRAFDRNDRELGVFAKPADAVRAILLEGQPCCDRGEDLVADAPINLDGPPSDNQ